MSCCQNAKQIQLGSDTENTKDWQCDCALEKQYQARCAAKQQASHSRCCVWRLCRRHGTSDMTSASIPAAQSSANDTCGAVIHGAHLQLGLLATSRWLGRHHQEPAQAAVEPSRHWGVLTVPCLHMECSVPAHTTGG